MCRCSPARRADPRARRGRPSGSSRLSRCVPGCRGSARLGRVSASMICAASSGERVAVGHEAQDSLDSSGFGLASGQACRGLVDADLAGPPGRGGWRAPRPGRRWRPAVPAGSVGRAARVAPAGWAPAGSDRCVARHRAELQAPLAAADDVAPPVARALGAVRHRDPGVARQAADLERQPVDDAERQVAADRLDAMLAAPGEPPSSSTSPLTVTRAARRSGARPPVSPLTVFISRRIGSSARMLDIAGDVADRTSPRRGQGPCRRTRCGLLRAIEARRGEVGADPLECDLGGRGHDVHDASSTVALPMPRRRTMLLDARVVAPARSPRARRRPGGRGSACARRARRPPPRCRRAVDVDADLPVNSSPARSSTLGW